MATFRDRAGILLLTGDLQLAHDRTNRRLTVPSISTSERDLPWSTAEVKGETLWLCVNGRAAVEAGKVLEGRLRGEEPLFMGRAGRTVSQSWLFTRSPPATYAVKAPCRNNRNRLAITQRR